MHRKGGITLRLAIPRESQRPSRTVRKVHVVKPQQSFCFFFKLSLTDNCFPLKDLRPDRNLGNTIPGALEGKESAGNVRDLGSILGLARSPGGGMATHSSILAWRIPMYRGAWRAKVPGVAKSQTQLSD